MPNFSVLAVEIQRPTGHRQSSGRGCMTNEHTEAQKLANEALSSFLSSASSYEWCLVTGNVYSIPGRNVLRG